jgi:2-amino-4-hydroxy-6-hydroxymethyldihydropteridine diphosphokinase
MTLCFIGAGANLGDTPGTLRWAREQLRSLPGLRGLRASALYRSAAVGPGEQNDYLNAVFAADCALDAGALLLELQSLETRAGRRRGLRWGPRTLDLDLLLFGSEQRVSEHLTLPHPRIFERNFVLLPLADLCPPEWSFPDGSTLAERLAACPDNFIERSSDCWQGPGASAGSLA